MFCSEDIANKMLRLHASYKKVAEVLTAGKKDGTKMLSTSVCASPVFVKSLMCSMYYTDIVKYWYIHVLLSLMKMAYVTIM